MLDLFISELAAQAALILAAALLGWIAHLRADAHRHWVRERDRAKRIAALPSQWCIPVGTVLGCL
jgi:hypothetical protein